MSWFTQPWGLLAFAALPAVVALHLFRRRFRDLPVSALFLWEDPQATESSGRRRQPLRRTPSFWLEMLAALLCALLLAGFDPLAGERAVHRIVVLDDTASMSADGVRESVIDALEEDFAAHGRRTRVTLIRSGVRPRLLAGPAALLPDARRALAAWQPSAPAHDPAVALDLARELAPSGEILWMTDRLPEEGEELGGRVHVRAFGEARDNWAIAEARRTRGPDGERLRVELRSFADRARRLTLTVSARADAEAGANAGGGADAAGGVDTASGADTELAQRAVRLEAGARTRLEIPLPPGTPALRVALDGDALPLDDRATLLPPVDHTVRLASALDEATAAALGAAELIEALPDTAAAPSLAAADLVLGHAAAPAPSWSLVMPHDPDDGAQAEAYIAGFLPEKAHPLMRGITLDGVVWTRRKDFEMNGLPVLAVGEHALLTETARGAGVVFQLNLIGPRSTLQRTPDWPILLANLVALRRAALPGPRAVNLVAGEAFELRHAGTHDYTWETLDRPGAAAAPEPRSMSATDVLRIEDAPSGRHRVRADDGAAWEFAVRFQDARESELRSRASGSRAPQEAAGLLRDRTADSALARLLLVALLLCVAGDWWVLRGRASA